MLGAPSPPQGYIFWLVMPFLLCYPIHVRVHVHVHVHVHVAYDCSCSIWDSRAVGALPIRIYPWERGGCSHHALARHALPQVRAGGWGVATHTPTAGQAGCEAHRWPGVSAQGQQEGHLEGQSRPPPPALVWGSARLPEAWWLSPRGTVAVSQRHGGCPPPPCLRRTVHWHSMAQAEPATSHQGVHILNSSYPGEAWSISQTHLPHPCTCVFKLVGGVWGQGTRLAMPVLCM